MFSKAELFLGREQYWFRSGCGTRDAIAAMRVICESTIARFMFVMSGRCF